LRWTRVGSSRVVTCQNCGFLADRVRPRPRTLEELSDALSRERRQQERRLNYVIEPSDPAERRHKPRRQRRASIGAR
jgi:hypothetical protein